MYMFKLQPVLDHRQFVEDTLKKELAEIKHQASMARQQMAALKTKENQTVNMMRQEQRQGLASDQVVGYHAFLRQLAERIIGQQRVIARIKAREGRKQGELLDAMKNRQIMEKLREQDFDRYNRTEQKKEMNFIDEIAVNQYARKANSGIGDGE